MCGTDRKLYFMQRLPYADAYKSHWSDLGAVIWRYPNRTGWSQIGMNITERCSWMENEFDLEPPWPGMHNILVQRFGAAAFIADGSHPMIHAEDDPPARLQPVRMPCFGNSLTDTSNGCAPLTCRPCPAWSCNEAHRTAYLFPFSCGYG